MPAENEIKLPLTSHDVNAERLAQLRQLYPEALTEGKIDFPKLRRLFGEDATEAAERYGLSWSGKSEAIKNIQTLTTATLLPAREESEKFDTTENLIIEGDNLEVLKLGAGDGLDDAEKALGIGAEHGLWAAFCGDGKGMYNLYPPFSQLGVALLHALDVLLRVSRIDESEHNILHDKPPFVVVNGAPDFLALEQGEGRSPNGKERRDD